MNWLIKAGIQGVLSISPSRSDLNYFFQRYITRSLVLNKAKLKLRLEWCNTHIEYYQKYRNMLPETVFELGTGWLLTVPLGLHLCGVKEIYTIDIHDLTKTQILKDMIQIMTSYTFEELQMILPHIKQELFEAFVAQKDQSPQEILKNCNIHFRVMDARHTDFADQQFDFFISNTTLEHIPYGVIDGIFKEFYRIAKQTALMSHLIDMSDHYSHFDINLSPYHFLQHNKTVWQLVNNQLMYQNRLRIPDFRRLHSDSYFQILYEKNQLKHAASLQSTHLAQEFKHYSPEDIIPTSSWMISERLP